MATGYGTHGLSPKSPKHTWSPSVAPEDDISESWRSALAESRREKSFRSWSDPANNPSWAEQAHKNEMERAKQLEKEAAEADASLLQSPGEPFAMDENDDYYYGDQQSSVNDGSKRASTMDDWSEVGPGQPAGESVSGHGSQDLESSTAKSNSLDKLGTAMATLNGEFSYADVEDDSREDDYDDNEYEYVKPQQEQPPAAQGEDWLNLPPMADDDVAHGDEQTFSSRFDDRSAPVNGQDDPNKFSRRSTDTDSYDDLVIIEEDRPRPSNNTNLDDSLMLEDFPTSKPRRRRDRSPIFRRIVLATICVALVAVVIAISIAVASGGAGGGTTSGDTNDRDQTITTQSDGQNRGISPPPGSNPVSSQPLPTASSSRPSTNPTLSPTPAPSSKPTRSPTRQPTPSPSSKPTAPKAVFLSSFLKFDLLYLASEMDSDTRSVFEETVVTVFTPFLEKASPNIYGITVSVVDQTFTVFGRRLQDAKPKTTRNLQDVRSLEEQAPSFGTLTVIAKITGYFDPDSTFQNGDDFDYGSLVVSTFVSSRTLRRQLVEALRETGEYYISFGVIQASVSHNVFENGERS